MALLKLNEICHHQMRFMGSSTSKIRLRPGLCPAPRWGSLQRSPRPSSWWGGARCQEPHPRSRPFGPRASALRASSLAPQTQKPNFAHRRWEICRTNQNTAATALFSIAIIKLLKRRPKCSDGQLVLNENFGIRNWSYISLLILLFFVLFFLFFLARHSAKTDRLLCLNGIGMKFGRMVAQVP